MTMMLTRGGSLSGTTLVQGGGGSLVHALKGAYFGPEPISGNMVMNPTGPGGALTTTFANDGEIADYSELRDGVRYGLPAMFAIGWAGSYLFWRWWWKRSGALHTGSGGYMSGLGTMHRGGHRKCKIVHNNSGRRRMCWDGRGKIISNERA